MKRTKKKNQLGKGKSGFFTREFGNVPERCTFTSKDINIGKNALDSLLQGAFFLKGESYGFTEFFKKSLKTKCTDGKLLGCYSILQCFNTSRDISDMLYDIFNPTEELNDEVELLNRFTIFFKLVISIIYDYIKLNPTSDKPILLSALSRQFDVILNYEKHRERLLKYIRAKVTNDKILLGQFNNSPVGDDEFIEKNKTSFAVSDNKLFEILTTAKLDINRYYNDKMEIFMEEDNSVKLYNNPDFKGVGQGSGQKGYGSFFLIFVVSMLGLSFIVEKSINWNNKDTFYI
jgi:hypothetical protein